ncbi:MAG: outer membrane beta-barrel protein [Fibrobacter sp.]|nr:outer membrane beta-barrel protein [Fibrobacter sp.]
MKKAFVIFALLASVAFAESHTHDGFFLNLALGAGYQKTTLSTHDEDFDVAGGLGSPAFNFKIGGRIVDNLILHASIINMYSAKVYKQLKDDYSMIGESMMGAGVTYYLPYNFFGTASLGMGRVFSVEDDDLDYSDYGFGLQAGVGKEWWVSDNWGLGVSAMFTYVSVSEDHVDCSAPGIAIMFSATYN